MKKNLKYLLRGKLSGKEIGLVPSSFDVIGDILVFSDFPKELEKKEKMIGDTILENYRNIRVILKKTKKYSGRFRTPKLKFIAGEKRKVSVCRENNVLLKLDVEKVYFSPRMGSERKRISQLVKPGESILVMFSGAGAYPIVIAKNALCKEVYGIEMNPTAHKYALENIKKNKLSERVKLFLGDVGRVLPKLGKKFDRILMPLPKGGGGFLGLTLKHIKNKGVIHFYDFLHEGEFEKAHQKIKMACENADKKFKILCTVKCGQYSPGFYRVCIDFQV